MGFSDELLHPRTAAHSRAAADAIQALCGGAPPDVALVLGTGLGPIADHLSLVSAAPAQG